MDHNTKFDVEIADASGHSIVQMTQNEIAEKATQTQGSWVFVNNQLVSAADIADMNLEAGSRIWLMPGLVGGQDAPTFVVQITDGTGHSEVVMTKAQIVEKATQDNELWVFVNNQLVNTADLVDLDMEAGSSVRMARPHRRPRRSTFVVQITDGTGHSEVVMTKAQIVEKATQNNELWVFVNNQLVSTADLVGLDMEAGSNVRMAPGLIGGQDAPTFDVEIADATGHSTVQMTQDELVEKAGQTQGSWVFVNNQLVSTAEIANMNLEAGSRIRLMPGLVGGQNAV